LFDLVQREQAMPVLINYDDVEVIPLGEGSKRQPLITTESVGNDCIVLDRWTIVAGGLVDISVAHTDLAWFQLLEGRATLEGPNGVDELSDANVVFLPPGFVGKLASKEGATVLYGGVPDAKRNDPNFEASSLEYRCMNWRAEPTLDSEHDERTRIYLVTPTLFGTKAVKGEMIIYPPGTKASNHHHEGAEHFQYIISGSGTALLSEVPTPIRSGDTLYNYEFERHNFINDGDEDLVFVEYFVPAECRTVWVDPHLVCAWNPTGKNIDGGNPSREIGAHSSAATINPEGV
jgi:quercetin dioxygenase-like cupin family protein